MPKISMWHALLTDPCHLSVKDVVLAASLRLHAHRDLFNEAKLNDLAY